MHKRLHLLIATAIVASGLSGLGFAALAIAPTASGAATTTPNCPTVSGALVKSVFGGSPITPATQTFNSNSFDGYKQSQAICDYDSNVSISFSTPATVTDYGLLLKTLKNVAGAKSVSGIGNDAFTGTSSNTISSCPASGGKCTNKTVTDDDLWVLVTNKVVFAIDATASKTAYTEDEALAKKIVPLV